MALLVWRGHSLRLRSGQALSAAFAFDLAGVGTAALGSPAERSSATSHSHQPHCHSEPSEGAQWRGCVEPALSERKRAEWESAFGVIADCHPEAAGLSASRPIPNECLSAAKSHALAITAAMERSASISLPEGCPILARFSQGWDRRIWRENVRRSINRANIWITRTHIVEACGTRPFDCAQGRLFATCAKNGAPTVVNGFSILRLGHPPRLA